MLRDAITPARDVGWGCVANEVAEIAPDGQLREIHDWEIAASGQEPEFANDELVLGVAAPVAADFPDSSGEPN